jgi:hypothetical protein
MAFKTLQFYGNDASPQHGSILRAIYTLSTPENHIRMLGWLSPIQAMHRHGAQGFMWGARGPFLPGAAMVSYGCVGHCWPLEATSDQPAVGIVDIVYGRIFFIPT